MRFISFVSLAALAAGTLAAPAPTLIPRSTVTHTHTYTHTPTPICAVKNGVVQQTYAFDLTARTGYPAKYKYLAARPNTTLDEDKNLSQASMAANTVFTIDSKGRVVDYRGYIMGGPASDWYANDLHTEVVAWYNPTVANLAYPQPNGEGFIAPSCEIGPEGELNCDCFNLCNFAACFADVGWGNSGFNNIIMGGGAYGECELLFPQAIPLCTPPKTPAP